jgi:hypothetical protein
MHAEFEAYLPMAGYKSELKLNSEEIKGANAVLIEADTESVTTVTIKLVPQASQIEGQARIIVQFAEDVIDTLCGCFDELKRINEGMQKNLDPDSDDVLIMPPDPRVLDQVELLLKEFGG